MRVLLSTYGSRGDTEPLVALAAALRTLGAEAIVSAPGEREFKELSDRTGVPLVPAFMPVRQWIENAKQSGKKLPELTAMMAAKQYPAIDQAADGCDAIIATGLLPSAAAAQCVAEKRGLPYAHVSFCPLYLPSHRHSPPPYPGHPLPPEETDVPKLWAHNAQVMNTLFGGGVNALRASIGLPQVDNIRDYVFTHRPWIASDPVLWPWQDTDMCDAVQTGAWILPDERPLPPDLKAFLDAGSPPVYIGFGSMAVQDAKAAAQAAIRAVRARGCRAILSRGWAEMALIDDQEDCFLIGEMNHQALFPQVAAVVHHGGAGTTTTAARAGAPQVIVPQVADQPFWAGRVADLGIGAAHAGPVPTFDSLSAALVIALDDETRQRAGAVAGAIRADGATIAAKQVFDLVGRKFD